MYDCVIPDELKFGGIVYDRRYTDPNSHVVFQYLSLLFRSFATALQNSFSIRKIFKLEEQKQHLFFVLHP